MGPRAKLLTSGELAERLGVSTSTVSDWARQGLIAPELRTAGGHYRWSEANVREQLAERFPRPDNAP